jgi:hypothetical protein
VAVSGTISQTTFDVMRLIEHAFRRCRVPAQKLTGEMIDIARDVLYLYLSSLAGRGIQLWAIDNVFVNVPVGQAAIALPVGTVDVLSVLQRRYTTLAGSVTTSNGGVLTDFGSGNANQVATVGVAFTSGGTYALNFDVSSDGVSFTTKDSVSSATYVAGQTYWFEVDPATYARFFRVADAAGQSLSVTVTLGGTNSEIELGRIAMDDYDNLPNKAYQGRPTQYWLDRQRDVPVLHIWPTADTANSLYPLAVRRQRQLMDVGALTNTLDIPQRWYDAICWQLAWRVAKECPEVDPALIPDLKMDAEAALALVTQSERDNSPIRVTPRIGVYTR